MDVFHRLVNPNSTLSTSPALSPNQFLAGLSIADFSLISKHLRTIELVQKAVLVEAGGVLAQIYFPHSGVISLVVNLENGNGVEVAMVGRDSLFGAAAALDGGISVTEAIIQLPGLASVLDVVHLRRAADSSVTFRTKLMRHEQTLFVQAQQSAACNVSHTVEARLSRWLLRMRDLTGSEILPLTQDFLAEMIGVQRNSVSVVAHSLQEAGLIQYSRGRIEITNVPALRETACECYAKVREQYKRLLHGD